MNTDKQILKALNGFYKMEIRIFDEDGKVCTEWDQDDIELELERELGIDSAEIGWAFNNIIKKKRHFKENYTLR